MIKQTTKAPEPLDIQSNQLLNLLQSSLRMYEELSMHEEFARASALFEVVISSRAQLVEEMEQALPAEGIKIDKRTNSSTKQAYPHGRGPSADLSAEDLDHQIADHCQKLENQLSERLTQILRKFRNHFNSPEVSKLHQVVTLT